MKLYAYQKDAVEELYDYINVAFKHNKRSIQILKAPTGSGKTIMLSSLIDQLSAIEDEKLCFLWISPGKGKLDQQSYNSLKLFLTGHKVSMLSSDLGGGRKI